MDRLNNILKELGISKVNLAKFLGVSRQMIYNYLELDDLNKWPKDKKVLLFNLLGIKSAEELNGIKVDTDYILDVESRLNNLTISARSDSSNGNFSGLSKKNKELLNTIVDFMKENLEDDDDKKYNTYKYLYHFMRAMNNSKELRYILAYVSKSIGNSKPLDFAFDEDDQFIFESILFAAMTLYNNGGASKAKLEESHKRFETQIEHKKEEKLNRTQELNSFKVQALKELNYNEINDENAAEVLEKIAEIEARKNLINKG